MEPPEVNTVSKRTRFEFLLAIAAHWTIVAALGGLVWAAGFYGIEWYWYGKSPWADSADWAETRRMVCLHLDIADSMLDSGLVSEAQEEYRNALKLDPNNIAARRGLLKSAIFEPFAGKEYDPAASRIRLDELSRSDPNDPHVDLYIGHLVVDAEPYAAMGHYRDAIKKAAKRPTCDPDKPRSEMAEAYSGLGQIYLTMGQYPQAFAEYERALALSTVNPSSLENFAYAAMLVGEYHKSEEAARKAIYRNFDKLGSLFTMVLVSLVNDKVQQARWAVDGLIDQIEAGKLARISHQRIGVGEVQA